MQPANVVPEGKCSSARAARRLCAPLVGSHRELGAKAWYRLVLTTCDERGAGTDADVHVQLEGSQGASAVMTLDSKPAHFERGGRDEFRLHLPRLGDPQRLTIGHNDRGAAPGWKLELAELTEEATGCVTYFACDRWGVQQAGRAGAA